MLVLSEETLDSLAQRRCALARLVEERGPLLRVGSFERFSEEGLLDCPQYTRPAEFRGWTVPEVLLGGNHEEIRKWRRTAAAEKTARVRPDLKYAGERPYAKRSDDQDRE